jgi:hypothetical protein
VRRLLDDDLTLTKIHALLTRQGVVVPYRTLHRFCVAEFGFGKDRLTVRVMDGEPGGELQVDFGRMDLLEDVTTGRCRVCWALIFTACYSRHMFVWLSFRQAVEDVIEGFEQAWGEIQAVRSKGPACNGIRALVTDLDCGLPIEVLHIISQLRPGLLLGFGTGCLKVGGDCAEHRLKPVLDLR